MKRRTVLEHGDKSKTVPASDIEMVVCNWLGFHSDSDSVDLAVAVELFGEPVKFKTRTDYKLVLDVEAYPNSAGYAFASAFIEVVNVRGALLELKLSMLAETRDMLEMLEILEGVQKCTSL